MLGDVAGTRHERVAAAERRNRRMEAGSGEKLERGEDAPIDPPGPYVAPPAVVDADPRVREHARGKCLGAQSPRARAFRGDIAGGLEQPPAVEEGPGIDPRHSVACR